MIPWLTDNASLISFVCGALAAGLYIFSCWRASGKNLRHKFHDMVMVGLGGASLPVSVLLVLMGVFPAQIPLMVNALEQFSAQLGIYGIGSFAVICYSAWEYWPRPRKD